MKNINILVEHFNSISELHKYLKNIFELPYYYGANLDALYDCLTDIAEPTVVVLPDEKTMYGKLGSYGKLMIQVFIEAAFENKNLIIDNESNIF